MRLNAERWTVIAIKAAGVGDNPDRWEYLPGFNVRNVNVAVATGRLLTAHKRAGNAGWHLVAKLPRPAEQVRR
jgi:hypothetical protein